MYPSLVFCDAPIEYAPLSRISRCSDSVCAPLAYFTLFLLIERPSLSFRNIPSDCAPLSHMHLAMFLLIAHPYEFQSEFAFRLERCVFELSSMVFEVSNMVFEVSNMVLGPLWALGAQNLSIP